MKILFSLLYQSLLINFRDKIFYALALSHLIGISLCRLISDWTMHNINEVLYDFGAFYLILVTSFVAIILSGKILDNTDGSLEGILALVQNRATYIMGRFLGLIITIFVSNIIFLAIWQLYLSLNNEPPLNFSLLAAFLILSVPSLLLAALGIFLSSFTQSTVTIISSVFFLFLGLISKSLADGLPGSASAHERYIVEFLAKYWNLQQFNLMEVIHTGASFSSNLLLWLGIYALNIIAIFMTFTLFFLGKKDI